MASHVTDLAWIDKRQRVGLGLLAAVVGVLLGMVERIQPGTPLLVYLLAGTAFVLFTGLWRLMGTSTWAPSVALVGALLLGSVAVEIAWEGLERVQSERTHGGDAGPFYPGMILGLLMSIGAWMYAAFNAHKLIDTHDTMQMVARRQSEALSTHD